jgi:hypothetical protein
MLLPTGRFVPLSVLAVCLLMHMTSCGKQSEQAVAPNELPPVARPADAPEYLRSLSLLYPQAELYRVPVAEKNAGKVGIILQKTNHPIEDVVRYYGETLRKHGFTETTHLVQRNGALLQYERPRDKSADKRELVSVDISKLPYAENLLIRIGRSETDHSRGGP